MVVVDGFGRQIRDYFADIERELPILKDAVQEFVKAGLSKFVFDLRGCESLHSYPIVKWGAMYGAVMPLWRLHPDIAIAVLAKNIKVVGEEDLMREVKMYRLDQFFERFDTTDAALAALAGC